jgi:hypothetical protein
MEEAWHPHDFERGVFLFSRPWARKSVPIVADAAASFGRWDDIFVGEWWTLRLMWREFFGGKVNTTPLHPTTTLTTSPSMVTYYEIYPSQLHHIATQNAKLITRPNGL